MKLDRWSRMVRWAYWLDDVPSQTTVCSLFWRAVLLTPLKGVGVGMMLTVFIGAPLAGAVALIAGLIAIFVAFHATSLIVLTTAAVLLLAYDHLTWRTREPIALQSRIKARVEHSVLINAAVAVKSKYCPIVEIER